jgi:hypothetical protein
MYLSTYEVKYMCIFNFFIWKQFFFSNTHDGNAPNGLTTALQCMDKDLKTSLPDRDSNAGSFVLEACAMTTMPRH